MFAEKTIDLTLNRPGRILRLALLLCLMIIGGVTAPFVSPDVPIPKLTIDTDPENMLAHDHPARAMNRQKSSEFGVSDTIVIAVENNAFVDGVFTPIALAEIAALTEFAAGLDGVIAADILSVTTIDVARPDGLGGVDIVPVMQDLPETRAEARDIRDAIARLPIYAGTFLSDDQRSVVLQIPVADRQDSHRIATALRDKATELVGGNSYSFTGLPVAQAQFGIEMFVQMAIAAPAAMALIYLLLLVIFRSPLVALTPMAVAMASTIGAMGALILTGQTVHIMSSMIPIFVMPIAVMDAIHILSDFADHRRHGQSRDQALREVMTTLWRPMLFTTVTTAAGFASLALAPIPPVQVFGIYVALGVVFAWLATILMVPAMLMLLPDRAIARLPLANGDSASGLLGMISRVTRFAPRRTLAVLTLLFGTSLYGLTFVQVNDNPIRWFAPGHEIRKAETVLAEDFGGAYMAYLSLSAGNDSFADPDMLNYVSGLQAHLTDTGLVGASVALPDLVRIVHRDMRGGGAEAFRLPGTVGEIEALIAAAADSELSPTLAKLVDADLSETIVWLQMPTGDNQDMRALQAIVADYLATTPAPEALKHEWFGLTQLNAVWQDEMVNGMLDSLLGGYTAVLLLMLVLFRSLPWAVLSILPLTASIGGIYGAIGWIGRDFDMPIAVLSSLSLGLAVDFAIHFVTRLRQLVEGGSLSPLREVYGEPARAIWRNALVLGVGFLPLLISPLVPYQTVGVLIPAILWIASIATLLLLGSLVRLMRRWLFRPAGTQAQRVPNLS